LTFNKGSLVLIDYTAKVKDSEEVFDTTIEEDAKKHSIHESNVKYLYDVNVVKSLDSPNDKVDGILKNRLPLEDSKITFELKDKEVNITIPEEILRADGLQIMKHFIQLDIFKFVPSLEKVNFIETHLNKQNQTKKTETKEEKTPEPKTA